MFINLIVLLFSTGQSTSLQIKNKQKIFTYIKIVFACVKKCICNLAFIWACCFIGQIITSIISYTKIKREINNIIAIRDDVEFKMVKQYEEWLKIAGNTISGYEPKIFYDDIVKELYEDINKRVIEEYYKKKCINGKIYSIKNALLTGVCVPLIMLIDGSLDSFDLNNNIVKYIDIVKYIIKRYFFSSLLALILIHYITPSSPLLLFKINGKSPIDRIAISKNTLVNIILKSLLHILKFPVFYVFVNSFYMLMYSESMYSKLM